MALTCFKAYDIRGKVPEDLNEDLSYRIGLAYANFFKPKSVAIGMDVRKSSENLKASLINGLLDGGCDVYDIGLCGTEEVYFATFNYKLDGGIMVTASHNPKDYNGMKFVQKEAIPVSGDSGLYHIKKLIEEDKLYKASNKGNYFTLNHKDAYIKHLLSYININNLKPLRIVVNPGNGTSGDIIKRLEEHLPFEFIKINFEPDGDFPNGVPNPLLPENRIQTAEALKKSNAHLGIAWDGDFDRCFLFDETGEFIEGYYLVGLLAKFFLEKKSGEKIIHDPRLIWNTIDIVQSLNGIPIMSKTGHAFIKERMRKEDAIYGGEMSSHHYFKDFNYCDSGMIPWLIIAEIMCKGNSTLSSLINERKRLFPISGEINRKVKDIGFVLNKIEEHFKKDANQIDYTDGLSMEFKEWRFNLRGSNTEPLLRLNVESRANVNLLNEMTEKILKLIDELS